MTKQTRLRRLRRLREIIVQRNQEGKLDMADFGLHEGLHAPKENNYCGTACCALGWASLDPSFRRAGLKGTWVNWETGFSLRVSYRDSDFFQAGAEFFGLYYFEASNVFAGGNSFWKTIEKLDELIAEYAE